MSLADIRAWNHEPASDAVENHHDYFVEALQDPPRPRSDHGLRHGKPGCCHRSVTSSAPSRSRLVLLVSSVAIIPERRSGVRYVPSLDTAPRYHTLCYERMAGEFHGRHTGIIF